MLRSRQPSESSGSRDARIVLVVDDHPVVRRGLVAMLDGEQGVARVVEAATAADARRLATLHSPHIAIVDLGLPDGGGVDLIRQLRTTVPGCTVVVMTMTNDPDVVQSTVDAGASAYLLKDSAPDVIVATARTADAGGRVFGPGVAAGRPTAPRPCRPAPPLDALTPRELQVLTLLAGGRATREVARQLSISEKTVRNQVAIITAKLGVPDRVQAVLLAHRSGLV